jgi:protein gp37
MGTNSVIEWTDHTFSPWIGCQKVSLGCDWCYAEHTWDHRYHRVEWGPHGKRSRTSPDYWRLPFKWAREADGTRPRVFCSALIDVFDNQVEEEWRADLFDLIRRTPALDWLLLTKRPENALAMLPTDWGNGWPNVWLGVSTEDQHWFDRRWPILQKLPAVVRFISYEPALGPLRLGRARPDWIICGGESGSGRRPMDLSWARAIRDECAAAGIAFFMKQVDKVIPIPTDLAVRQWPRGHEEAGISAA